MFDWLEFDEKRKKDLKDQIDQLQDFLGEYIKLNDIIKDMPINTEENSSLTAKLQDISIPEQGRDALEVGREMVQYIYGNSMLLQHPRFFSFVASAVSPYSLAGSILTDIYNPHAGAYMLSPGAAIVEEKICKWMASLAGYPEDTAGGIFLSGGSLSNLSAMAAARDNKLQPEEFTKGTVYYSDQAHSSNEKGLRIIGFRPDQLKKIPTDEHFHIRLDKLEQQIKEDIAAGSKPFLLIGSLGTTNTGSIDPFAEMGAIAQKYDMWFHIDGAFGGSSLISPIYRNLSRGIELSDSFSWDTHKWLMQVYSCSTLVVKDKHTLLNAFTEHPEYLADVINEEHYDGWDMGPEMSRPSRALKLWYTLQAAGTDMLAELIEYTWHNAVLVKDMLSRKDSWEILSEPSCATINFRYHPEGLSEEQLSELNGRITREINKTGFAFIVTTTILNKRCIRMCMLNANSTENDVILTVEKLDEIARKLAKEYLG